MNTETTEVVYPDSNRIGKFKIPHETLRDGSQRPMLQALFGLCVVLEAYEHESGRGKEYIAASEMFQALNEGEEIPEYRIECAANMAFENPEYQAKRLDSGVFGFVAIRNVILRVPPVSLRTTAHSVH